MPLPAAAEQPAGAMQHLGEGPAGAAALPGGWLVPAPPPAARASTARQHLGEGLAEMAAPPGRWLAPAPPPAAWASTAEQRSWRDVLGEPMPLVNAMAAMGAAVARASPATPPLQRAVQTPTVVAPFAHKRGLRNAPLAARRPAASPAASSNTIHGADELPSPGHSRPRRQPAPMTATTHETMMSTRSSPPVGQPLAAQSGPVAGGQTSPQPLLGGSGAASSAGSVPAPGPPPQTPAPLPRPLPIQALVPPPRQEPLVPALALDASEAQLSRLKSRPGYWQPPERGVEGAAAAGAAAQRGPGAAAAGATAKPPPTQGAPFFKPPPPNLYPLPGDWQTPSSSAEQPRCT